MARQFSEPSLKTIQNALESLSSTLDWLKDVDDREMLRLSQEMDSFAHNALLERVQSLVYALRRIRNRSSTINRLPTEILSIIFEFLMPPYPRIRFPPVVMDEMDMAYNVEPWVPDLTENYSTLWASIAAVSLVCRNWRDVALATPLLWTDILVSSHHGDFISTQLVRSTMYPLNVQFNGPVSPASLDLPFVQNLLKESYRIRRLTVWVPTESDDMRPWIKNATQLETLDIMSRRSQGRVSRSFRDFPLLSDLRTPRLQTLSVSNWGRRQTGTFRTLRYLVLDFERDISLVDLASGLMAVFAANAHSLEEVVVFDGIPWHMDEEAAPELNVSPVNMHALKRLVVKHGQLFHHAVEPKLVLHNCARFYQFHVFYHPGIRVPRIGDSNLFPVKKLFISESDIAATDGTSAVRTPNEHRDLLISPFLNEDDVRELWLSRWADTPCGNPYVEMPPPTASLLEPMLGVDKLIILRDEQLWLSSATNSDLFPALSELQLHSQVEASYPTILDFVTRRSEDGRAIKTLRFVRDPHQNCDTSDYSAFELRKSHLESYVANVVYENVPDGSKPPRMTLPAVCETMSTVHNFWDRWELD
ncbi:hypothetical protein BDW22DRAFT_932249 [Trametopsis cervina]|nr:hypothetical protein BDW22DRAFT_932249 [Trametopsis cervina]